MTYNPLIHNRQSMRLKDFDYGCEGLYFLTFCTQDRKHLFGNIVHGQMNLNNAGQIAHQCWLEIPNHFPHVRLHNFVIMPDHVHGIIEITENVGTGIDTVEIDTVGAKNFSPPQYQSPQYQSSKNKFSPDFKSPVKTVGSIVRGFKIGVTKWMRQNTNINTVWQRGYYDHIIRNDKSFFYISEYINRNPEKGELAKSK